MIILAIDPGYDRIGFAVMNKKGGKEEILHSECFQTSKKDSIYKRMFEVGKRTELLIEKFKVKLMVVESLFFSRNTKTAMRVAETRGITFFVAKKAKIKIEEFTPNQIKSAVAGHGQATKKDIEFVLQKVYKVDTKKKKDDELDAIALGFTHFAVKK